MAETRATGRWEFAEHVMKKIVDLMNAETHTPGFDPCQMLCGQLLAMQALMRTVPPWLSEGYAPPEWRALDIAMRKYLLARAQAFARAN